MSWTTDEKQRMQKIEDTLMDIDILLRGDITKSEEIGLLGHIRILLYKVKGFEQQVIRLEIMTITALILIILVHFFDVNPDILISLINKWRP